MTKFVFLYQKWFEQMYATETYIYSLWKFLVKYNCEELHQLLCHKGAQWAEALVRARFRAPNMMCFLKSKYERNGLKNQNIGLRIEKNALQSSKAPSFQQKDT